MNSSRIFLLLFLQAICRDDPMLFPLQSVSIVNFIGFPDGKHFFILRKNFAMLWTHWTLNVLFILTPSPQPHPFFFLSRSLHTSRCPQWYGQCMSNAGFLGGGGVKALICSICQLSWQKYSHPCLFSVANELTWQLLHKTPESVAVLAPELVPAATGLWCAAWLLCLCTCVTTSYAHPEASPCRPSSAPPHHHPHHPRVTTSSWLERLVHLFSTHSCILLSTPLCIPPLRTALEASLMDGKYRACSDFEWPIGHLSHGCMTHSKCRKMRQVLW